MAGRISAIVVVLFVTMVIVEGLKCPVRPRGSRKKQRERLHALQPHHVVVNAKFNGIDVNDRFRFIVNQVWSKNNGQLVVNDEITVGADNSNLKPCFNKLALTKYILMLEPVSGEGKHRFMALEPVVLAENHRHKQRVFEALCEKENNRCIMRVIMPAREILYRGSTGILTCDVESTSPLVSVQWLKDGRDVDTATYRAAGLYVQKNSLFDSKL
uniref:Ig-like domain-containing protein n=1 Tax=Ciona savignyi TaxID=51511 RepID=H2YIJ5_CIOSA